jgi:RNA polymerase sigma factor (TIGR02999 family)
VPETEKITSLLQAVRSGEAGSADKLMSAMYSDLRQVARRYMASERAEHTLQPTAVVNEVYLRLFRPDEPAAVDWQNRAHFLGVAAKQMRQILIDHARSRRAAKRDFGVKIALQDAGPGALATAPQYDFETLDELLNLLASKDPEAARVVELKFFGGLTDREAALVMGVNVARIRRDWEFARSWLRHRMSAEKT